ncbi:hypothetical protein [Terrihabitans soli]|uniref:hypothetical protein n=1 Tax=Terrihabitans soli TaxID=708113 RepID=UPI001CA36EFB|nr:hypothetical protein [Terrihabitans soli]
MTGRVETTGTGLVASENGTRSTSGRFRPSAPIVTQLFAAKLDLPQARARRRASAEEATGAYGATRTVLKVARRLPGMSWPA